MADRKWMKSGRRAFLCRTSAVLGTGLTVGCVEGNDTKSTIDHTAPPTATPDREGTPEAMTPFDASEMDDFPNVEPFEREIHKRTNEVRQSGGLDPLGDYDPAPPVDFHEDMAYVARTHSRDMAVNNYIDHVNPEGEHPWDRAQRYGLYFKEMSENILATSVEPWQTPRDKAEAAVKTWMKSEEHRENLLTEKWDLEGIGVYIEDGGGFWATQLFAAKREDEATALVGTGKIVD